MSLVALHWLVSRAQRSWEALTAFAPGLRQAPPAHRDLRMAGLRQGHSEEVMERHGRKYSVALGQSPGHEKHLAALRHVLVLEARLRTRTPRSLPAQRMVCAVYHSHSCPQLEIATQARLPVRSRQVMWISLYDGPVVLLSLSPFLALTVAALLLNSVVGIALEAHEG